ncbi:minor capsid protein 2 [Bacillus phage vB_BpsS-140]
MEGSQMNKEWLDQLSKPILNVYRGIETKLLLNIADQLGNGLQELYDSPDVEKAMIAYRSSQLSRIGDLNDKQIAVIASQAGKSNKEIIKLLEQAGFEAVQGIESHLEYGASKGILLKPPSIYESMGLKKVLDGYNQFAQGRLNATNTTMVVQSDRKFLEVLNQVTGDVLSGSMGTQQAMRKAINNLGNKGIPALIASNGAEWSPETYLNTVIRSTANNVRRDMKFTRMDEYGSDLVETSSHMGARPKCAPYQGKIFSRSGTHPTYPPLTETSMGEPDGLFGINCGHTFYVFIEGLSTQSYFPIDEDTNEQAYDRSQVQRKIESDIRKNKRKEEMFRRLGDDNGAKLAHQKVLDNQAKMRKFINDTGRTRRRAREQIL